MRYRRISSLLKAVVALCVGMMFITSCEAVIKDQGNNSDGLSEITSSPYPHMLGAILTIDRVQVVTCESYSEGKLTKTQALAAHINADNTRGIEGMNLSIWSFELRDIKDNGVYDQSIVCEPSSYGVLPQLVTSLGVGESTTGWRIFSAPASGIITYLPGPSYVYRADG